MYIEKRNLKRLGMLIVTILIITLIFAAQAASETTVSVDAPEHVSGSKFNVEIEIDDVEDLDSGQFDISFNSSVVNVTDVDEDVENGEIGSTEVPVENKYRVDNDTIRLLFNLPGVNGVSGDGTLATIKFEVVGKDGGVSFLNLSNGVLVDKESEKIEDVNWIGGMVAIGNVGGTRDTPGETLTKYTVTVYVKNLDDDKLDIHLLVDGNDEGFESVSSGKTTDYDDYDLEEGVHTFKIKWFDTDTDKWHEKTEEHTITDVTTITLLTEENNDEDNMISARVYVKNNDDDPVNVYLYIDDTYKTYETIEAGDTCDYEEDGYEFDEEESHSFTIKWIDPDTDVEYEKITRQYIETAESVTMHVDSHTEDDLTTTSLLASDSPPSESSSSQSRSAPATSAASDTSAGSGTSALGSQSSTTVLQTDPTPSGSGDTSSGSGDSQPYQHLYSLVGVVAIVFAMMQIRRV